MFDTLVFPKFPACIIYRILPFRNRFAEKSTLRSGRRAQAHGCGGNLQSRFFTPLPAFVKIIKMRKLL